jgi:hypothetical protein
MVLGIPSPLPPPQLVLYPATPAYKGFDKTVSSSLLSSSSDTVYRRFPLWLPGNPEDLEISLKNHRWSHTPIFN